MKNITSIIAVTLLLTLAACGAGTPSSTNGFKGTPPPTTNVAGWQDGKYIVTLAGNSYDITVSGDSYIVRVTGAPASGGTLTQLDWRDIGLDGTNDWSGLWPGTGNMFGFTSGYHVVYNPSSGTVYGVAAPVSNG